MNRPRPPAGWWWPSGATPEVGDETLRSALHRLSDPLMLLVVDGRLAIGQGGRVALSSLPAREPPASLSVHGLVGEEDDPRTAHPLAAYVPPCRPEHLGDPTFLADHRLRYAYVGGAMANGISSTAIVESLSRAGMLGSFGAAGLDPAAVEAAIDRVQLELGQLPYAFNLIHSPNEPGLEAAVADLFIRRDVRLVEASAYLNLTLPLVRYRLHGIHRTPSGEIVTPNRVLAKASRVEVATRFLSPPPEKLVAELVAQGHLTAEQAALARHVPVAQDLTAEADSGGHTDNRPLVTLLPALLQLRDTMQAKHGYRLRLRIGAAGGIATPSAAAAAFAMGAAYVMAGSIHQACVEAGTCDSVREVLAKASQADVAMAPAADMFEMGVKVQVLKRGTMFAMRATRLYEAYRQYASLEEIPEAERCVIEREILAKPFGAVWQETRDFFSRRDPSQIERAEHDAKHKMALVFRWYLGQASRWANSGDPARVPDYQVWCGPAMGAFNEWAMGSFLEDRRERRVVVVALNMMIGAAVLTRVQALRVQGVTLGPELTRVTPMKIEEIQRCLA